MRFQVKKERPSMSEHVLKFLVSELQTIRIICRKDGCNTVIEMAVAQLASPSPPKIICPNCRSVLQDADVKYDDAGLLARAIVELKRRPHMDVEFVLPEKDCTKKE